MNLPYDEAVREMELLVDKIKELFPTEAYKLSVVWSKILEGEASEEQLAESYEAGYSNGREEGGDARYDEGYNDGYSDAESEYGVKGSE